MRRLGGFVAALACLAMVAGACSKDSKGAAGRATTTTEVPVPIAFTTTSFDVVATADPAEGAAAGAQAGIEATFRRWLDEDILGPLRSAVPAGDLRHNFTAVTGERVATTPDRAAFASDGLPPVTGLKAETATLAVVGLTDLDGQIPIATVHLELKLHGTAEGTPLTVEHAGELVLVPDGDGWKIDSYDVRATRDTAGAATTTTAKS
ncbi:MAG: hypothetical protein QOG82_1330 [Actinomycetota bacterium]|jgi:hypothetical protein|nr:hypothetical protein [Actinomycetota bacterium]